MKPWRTRCSVCSACWSGVLPDTKRRLGICSASQMATVSAASVLPRMPERRYRATNLGPMRRTAWPAAANSRAQ